MSGQDRRGLNLGVALLAIGLYFLLSRHLDFRGPGPILLLIGTVLLVVSALRDWHGPTVPGCVLLGLGTAFLVREPLERWMPGWATLLLGIGSGLLLSAGLDRLGGKTRPGPLVPGLVLVAIAAISALTENFSLPQAFLEATWRLWPWLLVAAGVVLVVRALTTRRAP